MKKTLIEEAENMLSLDESVKKLTVKSRAGPEVYGLNGKEESMKWEFFIGGKSFAKLHTANRGEELESFTKDEDVLVDLLMYMLDKRNL